ncbi:MAG TPA: hypothetical protein IAC84_03225 [Firmicutes bacterium]|nr:hypothetical protein [Bacillota bacterium]
MTETRQDREKEGSVEMEQMDWKQRLARLLSVKSLVTLALTAVFAVLAFTRGVDQDFMTVYTVIIAFYFGTQSERQIQAASGTSGTSGASGGKAE